MNQEWVGINILKSWDLQMTSKNFRNVKPKFQPHPSILMHCALLLYSGLELPNRPVVHPRHHRPRSQVHLLRSKIVDPMKNETCCISLASWLLCLSSSSSTCTSSSSTGGGTILRKNKMDEYIYITHIKTLTFPTGSSHVVVPGQPDDPVRKVHVLQRQASVYWLESQV